MDRYEARRRRRRRGQMRLAVLIAAIIVVIIAVTLLARGCGGCGGKDDSPAPTAPATHKAAADSPKPAASPKPVSTKAPLVSLGDAVRFQTPQGAVVQVKVAGFTDPAEIGGVSADPGQRLVSLQLTVTAEGQPGTAAVPLPFEVADSFVLVMQDDELSGAKMPDDGLLGASLAPGKSMTTTLAFSVGASPPVRFVCKPEADTLPVSATWKLD